jgi:hypothetical protein
MGGDTLRCRFVRVELAHWIPCARGRHERTKTCWPAPADKGGQSRRRVLPLWRPREGRGREGEGWKGEILPRQRGIAAGGGPGKGTLDAMDAMGDFRLVGSRVEDGGPRGGLTCMQTQVEGVRLLFFLEHALCGVCVCCCALHTLAAGFVRFDLASTRGRRGKWEKGTVSSSTGHFLSVSHPFSTCDRVPSRGLTSGYLL